MAISKGLQSQALLSVRHGADLTLSRDVYGGPGPIHESEMMGLRERVSRKTHQINGRIIGRTFFVNRIVAVAGLDRTAADGRIPLSQGRWFEKDGEVLAGYGLAGIFNLQPGVRFSLAANPDQLFTVAGILRPHTLWDSDLLIMSIADAQSFFRMKGYLTEIRIQSSSEPSHPAPDPRFREQEKRIKKDSPPLHLMNRQEAELFSSKGFQFKNGVFILFSILLVVLTIPALLISSGLGARESIQEIGLMKSMGWSRTHILFLTALEYGSVSLIATGLATVSSIAWMKLTNGFLLAKFFIAEVGLVPAFQIPTRYLPLPSLTGLFFALLILSAGSLWGAWYGTRKAPFEALH